MANSGSYLRLTRKVEGSEFSENSPAKIDTSARGGSPTSEWAQTQGCSPHVSGKIQKYLRPCWHSPKGEPQMPGNKQQTIGKIIGELEYPKEFNSADGSYSTAISRIKLLGMEQPAIIYPGLQLILLSKLFRSEIFC